MQKAKYESQIAELKQNCDDEKEEVRNGSSVLVVGGVCLSGDVCVQHSFMILLGVYYRISSIRTRAFY